MTKTSFPATLLCDFYKVNHREQYPDKTEYIYSTFTPRSNKYFPQADKVVVFGIQSFIKKYLISYFNEHFFNRDKNEVVAEYKRLLKFALGVENPDASHIEDLHELGYLPIKIKAGDTVECGSINTTSSKFKSLINLLTYFSVNGEPSSLRSIRLYGR